MKNNSTMKTLLVMVGLLAVLWPATGAAQDVRLYVESKDPFGRNVGSPSPAGGLFPSNTYQEVSVTSPWIYDDDYRATCTGFERTGSEPEVDTSGNTSDGFVITVVTTQKWTWTTDFLLTTVINGSGHIDLDPAPDGNWYTNGQSVTLTAVPEGDGVTFAGWSGDASGSTNPLTITMDSPKTVTANFVAPGDVDLTVVSTNINGLPVGKPRVNDVSFPSGSTAPRTAQ